MRTQVAIVGAGPSGLLLAHLLHLQGIESVVLERQSREYVEHRVRAGVLEQGTVDTLRAAGLADRLLREGLVHHGIELRFTRHAHRIALSELSGGRSITIYGQQELVKDLVRARLETGRALYFQVADLSLDQVAGPEPVLRFRHGDRAVELHCDFVAGCDGFHGVCRKSIPASEQQVFHYDYPYAWVGVLAAVAPSTDEVIYAHHEDGLAMHSLRSPELSRLYLQCSPHDVIAHWSDDRIWSELHRRLATDDGWVLQEGPILEKSITAMRSFVVEPMQYGRLFLAGDSAHIVPPTGAKGLNLAVSDVRALADALSEWFVHGRDELLAQYSATCLQRVWRAQHFSAWMTQMLHRAPDDSTGFMHRLQVSHLRYIAQSRAAATSLAENYVGYDLA